MRDAASGFGPDQIRTLWFRVGCRVSDRCSGFGLLVFFSLLLSIVVAMFDLVHDVETLCHFAYC